MLNAMYEANALAEAKIRHPEIGYLPLREQGF
jgi:hypothetical protein